jgi:hypothetical protein
VIRNQKQRASSKAMMQKTEQYRYLRMHPVILKHYLKMVKQHSFLMCLH